MQRKRMLLVLILIILIALFLPRGSKEFRIRVVAASDSTEDQREKHAVVRVLKEEIGKFNRNDIINEVERNIDLLKGKVSEVLQGKEFEMVIAEVRFLAKEYDGKIISGGKYRTLLVVIGEGRGKNWWSILYPEYHGISFEDKEEIKFEFYFYEKFREIFSKIKGE
ncbi:MAG TPA: hypothetical protein GYA05_03755 [Acholeplasmataceae bacterium]|nr:hypothetical protein [Acholeplasmataceae bacterium]